MSAHRREPVAAAAACVVGGLLAAVAAGRPWVVQHLLRPPLPPRSVAHTGADLAPGLGAAGYVAVAGALALAATRGRVRVLLGVVLGVVGVAVVALAVTAPAGRAGSRTGWPWAAAAGGVAVAAGGGLTAARGRRWAGMSPRYEAPTASRRQADPEVAQWEALDRGDDPTAAG